MWQGLIENTLTFKLFEVWFPQVSTNFVVAGLNGDGSDDGLNRRHSSVHHCPSGHSQEQGHPHNEYNSKISNALIVIMMIKTTITSTSLSTWPISGTGCVFSFGHPQNYFIARYHMY